MSVEALIYLDDANMHRATFEEVSAGMRSGGLEWVAAHGAIIERLRQSAVQQRESAIRLAPQLERGDEFLERVLPVLEMAIHTLDEMAEHVREYEELNRRQAELDRFTTQLMELGEQKEDE